MVDLATAVQITTRVMPKTKDNGDYPRMDVVYLMLHKCTQYHDAGKGINGAPDAKVDKGMLAFCRKLISALMRSMLNLDSYSCISICIRKRLLCSRAIVRILCMFSFRETPQKLEPVVSRSIDALITVNCMLSRQRPADLDSFLRISIGAMGPSS